MKISLQLFGNMAAAILFLGLTSCRSNDTDNNLNVGGVAAVKFNLTGSDYVDDNLAQASLKKMELNNVTQSQNVLIDPSTVMKVELSEELPKSSAQASLSSIASVTNGLGNGVTYRVIAYKTNGGAYAASMDYKVGTTPKSLELEVGTNYTIVAYSNGGTTPLPAIDTNVSLSSITVDYDPKNPDLMYWKGTLTPKGGNDPGNNLNITLRHKTTQITTILKSMTGSSITTVSNAILRPHYTTGKLALLSGAISRSGNISNIPLSFPSGSSSIKTASPVFMNASGSGTFSANVTMDGNVSNISLPNAFTIRPETKKNLTVEISKCGAYINNDVWKEFSCYNLGADTTANPFTPSSRIHGAKYQWGHSSAALSQSADQNNTGNIPNWNIAAVQKTSWTADPCPSGYSVPSKSIWDQIISNSKNTFQRIGTWTSDIKVYNNYSAGVQIGNSLFLPAAGWRGSASGELDGRASRADYWSSDGDGLSLAYFFCDDNGVGVGRKVINYGGSTQAMPVRCMKN
ncbi:fibrobacter succinogenes major paralogous domain-containing protein [Elizabethkingia anophelis]|uniref:hypothetical protein n=1 Tax=Elizabethkingia anophelis TaxID=1117645 RepID=UPI001367B315|nr:hypothetical protein [Elizabethkingia anophelis]MYY27281.1 hypothetical protein [Elizabethkingia anophelis]